MKSYGVASVEQLADRFEIRAKIAEKVEGPKIAKAWRDAAEMVRGTTFVGWEQKQSDGRTNHEGRRRHIAEDR